MKDMENKSQRVPGNTKSPGEAEIVWSSQGPNQAERERVFTSFMDLTLVPLSVSAVEIGQLPPHMSQHPLKGAQKQGPEGNCPPPSTTRVAERRK